MKCFDIVRKRVFLSCGFGRDETLLRDFKPFSLPYVEYLIEIRLSIHS